MLGIGKKVEKVRKALHDALVARANMLIQEHNAGKRDHAQTIRAFVLLDLADIVRVLTIEGVEDE